ncbi:Patatin-like phospholipase domain-containing 1 [Chlorella sorokiniana]|uniref:Patatin n=1 Tax=Chlorella sorokiniana TaxID=3076 RepID=A0A2P6TM49_CHLSO|nr:Patatin-like phospholipase domain-containing 1 [Chlorella sorokiniana]|eukprot:PRW45375.1 Patatin-like phospholipase domain-containing 1 [Chlorella sorokiniana]
MACAQLPQLLPPANGTCLEHSGACTPCKQPGTALAAPSPDTAVKRLIGTLDVLQQQQEHAEARRLEAEQAAAAAAAEAAHLKAELHAALARAADLDDSEQAVQGALDARLQQQAAAAEQLRLAKRRLSGLRAESSGAAEELQQKQALAAELQAKLRAAGVDEATLVQLCSDAAHSCVAATSAGDQAAAEEQQPYGRRRATWLGGGSGGGLGLLGSFRRHAPIRDAWRARREEEERRAAAPAAAPAAAQPVLDIAGGGMWFFWKIGAVHYLQNNHDLSRVQLHGSSSGAIVAVLAACGVNLQQAALHTAQVLEEHRVRDRLLGVLGLWGGIARQCLQDLLPEDAHQRCTGRVRLRVTAWPSLQPVFIQRFHSKQDVIDACLASGHLPFLLDGRLAATMRGMRAVDGAFCRWAAMLRQQPGELLSALLRPASSSSSAAAAAPLLVPQVGGGGGAAPVAA